MSSVLAFDFGVKKMGVAVGNTITETAQPLDIITMNNGQPDWTSLLKMITDWSAGTILVGLPLNMDSTTSHLSKRSTKFAKRLKHKLTEQKVHIDFYMVDERLSSYLVKDSTNSFKNIDDQSACVLLEAWFENKQGQSLN